MTLASSIQTPPIDWFAIATVLTLLGAAGIALLGAVLVPRRFRRTFAAGVSALGFTGGIVAAVWLYVDSPQPQLVIAGAFYRDRWTALAQVIICVTGLVVSLLAVDHVPGWERDADPNDPITRYFSPASSEPSRS